MNERCQICINTNGLICDKDPKIVTRKLISGPPNTTINVRDNAVDDFGESCSLQKIKKIRKRIQKLSAGKVYRNGTNWYRV